MVWPFLNKKKRQPILRLHFPLWYNFFGMN